MSFGVIPKPGTKLGPCKKECEHRDCSANRRIAKSECAICSKPIGFATKFFACNLPDTYEHAECAWVQIEQEHERKVAKLMRKEGGP